MKIYVYSTLCYICTFELYVLYVCTFMAIVLNIVIYPDHDCDAGDCCVRTLNNEFIQIFFFIISHATYLKKAYTKFKHIQKNFPPDKYW